MGDPAGIGPEIVVRAAGMSAVRRACRMVVYGDEELLAHSRAACGISVGAPSAIEEIVAVTRFGARRGLPRPGLRSGEAAFRYLEAAAGAVAAGELDALVTAPLNKLWMNRAGHAYDGHTGYLSELSGKSATMMLAGRRLRVVLATTHIALADVPKALTIDGICHAGRTVARHLAAFHDIARPRIAVAALNPHAGEEGLFGDEEGRIIAPAVRRLRRSDLDVHGPLPADTLFAAAVAGHYDAVLCMYHDQALIPLKLVDFGSAVNVSMGLPFLRTSPDHGTAFEIAGQGEARADSMVASLLTAARMVRVRDRSTGRTGKERHR